MPKQKVEKGLADLLKGRMNAFMERKGINGAEMGRKAHVSQSMISAILTGRTVPSQLTVDRIEAAMKEEPVLPPTEQFSLDQGLQSILEVSLEEAKTKGVLDRLIQYIFREAEDADPDKVRKIASSLIVAHLSRYEGRDRARELLKLHDLIRG